MTTLVPFQFQYAYLILHVVVVSILEGWYIIVGVCRFSDYMVFLAAQLRGSDFQYQLTVTTVSHLHILYPLKAETAFISTNKINYDPSSSSLLCPASSHVQLS